MMTKKNYIQFADMIACQKVKMEKEYPTNAHLAFYNISHAITRLFESDNPSFDAKRFEAYIDKRVSELTDHV